MRMPTPPNLQLIGSNQPSLLTIQPRGGNVIQTQPQQIMAKQKSLSTPKVIRDMDGLTYRLRAAKDRFTDLYFMGTPCANHQELLDVAASEVQSFIDEITNRFILVEIGEVLNEGTIYPVIWQDRQIFVITKPITVSRRLFINGMIIIS